MGNGRKWLYRYDQYHFCPIKKPKQKYQCHDLPMIKTLCHFPNIFLICYFFVIVLNACIKNQCYIFCWNKSQGCDIPCPPTRRISIFIKKPNIRSQMMLTVVHWCHFFITSLYLPHTTHIKMPTPQLLQGVKVEWLTGWEQQHVCRCKNDEHRKNRFNSRHKKLWWQHHHHDTTNLLQIKRTACAYA